MAAAIARPSSNSSGDPEMKATAASPRPATSRLAGASACSSGAPSTAAIATAPTAQVATCSIGGWSLSPTSTSAHNTQLASQVVRFSARMPSRPTPSKAAEA